MSASIFYFKYFLLFPQNSQT